MIRPLPAPISSPGPVPSPSDPRIIPAEAAPGEALLGEGLSEPVRQRLTDLLAEFPPELLDKLAERGVTLESATQLKMADQDGYFDPRSRKVMLLEGSLLGDKGKAVLAHELGHAVDFLLRPGPAGLWKGMLSKILKPRAHSTHAPGLQLPHQRFLAKEAVHQAVEIRTQMGPQAPGVQGFQLGPLQGTLVTGAAGTDMIGTQKEFRLPLAALAQAGLGVALGVAGAVASGGLGLALLAVGLGLTAQAGQAAHTDIAQQRSDQPVLFEVQDGHGLPVQVSQRGRMTAVNLPKQAVSPALDWTEHSAYIAHSRDSREEYFAEGVSAYLESGPRREKLKVQEPELFEDVETTLHQFQIAPGG